MRRSLYMLLGVVTVLTAVGLGWRWASRTRWSDKHHTAPEWHHDGYELGGG